MLVAMQLPAMLVVSTSRSSRCSRVHDVASAEVVGEDGSLAPSARLSRGRGEHGGGLAGSEEAARYHVFSLWHSSPFPPFASSRKVMSSEAGAAPAYDELRAPVGRGVWLVVYYYHTSAEAGRAGVELLTFRRGAAYEQQVPRG